MNARIVVKGNGRQHIVGLAKYQQKRHFDRTPEPSGKTARTRGALRFVVQKHDASRLHYDFRLELDGTLKSWAVPKGPSMNPEDKRLAVMVEDHPLDYRTFEGTIPEGNYGAGTVMVWDQGTYSAQPGAGRRETEAALREGLERGHLSFVLEGSKLKGAFSLLRLRRGKENEWLLVKKRDDSAAASDVTQEDRSVATGRDLEEIAMNAKKTRRPKAASPRKGRTRTAAPAAGSPAKMPGNIQPMLARLVAEPFDRAGWLFEVKWDGYRAIAEVDPKGVSLYSRNQKSFAGRYAPVATALRELGHEAVLDGEIVVVDEQGKSDFQLLQNYQKTGKGRLRYYVFDLLYLDGRDLRKVPLRQRKELLAEILTDVPDVYLSEHVEKQGVAFFAAAREKGLEGIMAKDAKSPYREGYRNGEWLKIKTHFRQEAVICGFTEPRGSRKNLGALVLGVYEDDKLVYIGHTGGGFNARGLAELRAQLDPLVQKRCPFREQPATNAPVHWLRPELVCEVSFQEWTQDGVMRQPIFVGLREDKPPRDVHREIPRAAKPATASTKKRGSRAARAEPMPGATKRSRALEPALRTRMAGEPVLTNLNKVYWPKEGYTKGDLIDYYRTLAPVLLPYLRDRPESLHRHPGGISGKSFFQKDVSRQPPPPGVETVTLSPESGEKDVTYLVCQDEATLLYLANLGCIEINPWFSRIGSLENPDFLVIDLDPEAVPFAKVIEAAQHVRKVLERAGAECYCKTSGKRGLHVAVPLGARYSYDQAKQFAEIVAHLVHEELPGSTSLVRSPAQRQGRVYLDYLQNRRGQTLAVAYSVRPHPGATVSAPLEWKEVRKGLNPAAFTIRTMLERLEKRGDLWQAVLGAGIDLKACLERLAK